MQIKDKNSSFKVTTLIFLFPLIVLLLYGTLSHIFFFYTQQKENQSEVKQYAQTLVDIEKNRLKEKVENFAQFISYYDSKSSDKIKKDAKSIVSLAVNIANNIYHNYKDVLSQEQLQQLLIKTLSNIKFEGDLGYMFVLDLDGNTYVHIDPKLVNHNIINIRDVNGKYIIKEFNKVLKEKGEGFVDYYWYIVKEGHKNMHYKISYVKMLDCYNWYIGAGEYLKYMKKYVREDILSFLNDNNSFKDGFLYITDKNANLVYQPKDKNVTSITKLRANKGFFIDKNYMSYSSYIPEYGWYITAIKDLTNINHQIAIKQRVSENKRKENVKTNYILILISWIVSLLLSIYLSTIIKKRLKRYEKQLQESNQQLIFQSRQALLGELLPMIAHQWRQPINKIASVLALLRFMPTQKDKHQQKLDNYYKDIENSIEFMSETIDDFREFYQPKRDTSMQNLKLLIEKSVDFVNGYIKKKDLKVNMDLEEIYYMLYPNEFLQVIINLIKNSVDALEEGGQLDIELKKRKNDIIIHVQDNGIGISNKDIKNIFSAYFTTKENSMGLGLYMSKIIVEQHMGGSLHVKRLAKGTMFYILFPLKLSSS